MALRVTNRTSYTTLQALIRWHPDKFESRFQTQLTPSEVMAVMERVLLINVAINDQWLRMIKQKPGGNAVWDNKLVSAIVQSLRSEIMCAGSPLTVDS
jgi:hypothetical protein